MGTLKPGATYIYEHVNGITYAREFGQTDRFEIGRSYVVNDYMEDKLWGEIHRAAKNNPALQEVLDRAKLLYYLSKENGQK
jgi:hypothetical protein